MSDCFVQGIYNSSPRRGSPTCQIKTWGNYATNKGGKNLNFLADLDEVDTEQNKEVQLEEDDFHGIKVKVPSRQQIFLTSRMDLFNLNNDINLLNISGLFHIVGSWN